MPATIEKTSASAVHGQCRLRASHGSDPMANSIVASMATTAQAMRRGRLVPCRADSSSASPAIAALLTGNARRCSGSNWSCPLQDESALQMLSKRSAGVMEKSIEAATPSARADRAVDVEAVWAAGHCDAARRRVASTRAAVALQTHEREAPEIAAGSQTALQPSSACAAAPASRPLLPEKAQAPADSDAFVISPPLPTVAGDAKATVRHRALQAAFITARMCTTVHPIGG
ncbi:MAG: hypothetical protein EOO54_04740 [Haliea sp.]|nr:MAG: hypothetical protein EOO54_04740 [Haliea sp.]